MELKNFLNNEKITITKLAEKLGIKKQTVCSQIKYWATDFENDCSLERNFKNFTRKIYSTNK